LTAVTTVSERDRSAPATLARADRDSVIDTMRGIAILMVIGIHSLQQPLAHWTLLVDAALRPCVPVFLFASGVLTARSGRVPLRKRMIAALIPYAVAFVAAYLYMAAHNPAMDHRITTTVARFVLAYVSVYYYVFVYIGCTIAAWLAFRVVRSDQVHSMLEPLMLFAILLGLLCGSYLEPLSARWSLSPSLIEEARMRDLPFWFGFFALGVLFVALDFEALLRGRGAVVILAALGAYAIYVAVRVFNIGDSADYDSTAYFLYAALFCIALSVTRPAIPSIAALGSGSYFLYLWHIFVIWMLRDHTNLYASGALTASMTAYGVTALTSIVALVAVRKTASARVAGWVGA
jgi:surface polysaccharide O-acyltransferase-like enzyme